MSQFLHYPRFQFPLLVDLHQGEGSAGGDQCVNRQRGSRTGPSISGVLQRPFCCASFSTMASFFFIIGNGFQRFVGQTFITSISFKYTVCGKKGRKKISSPGERNSPPGFQVLATGLLQRRGVFPSMFGNFEQSDWACSNFNTSSRVSRLGFLQTTLWPWRMSGNGGGGGGGGISKPLNSEAQVLLRWSESLNVTLLPQFVMGSHNVIADSLSHKNQVIGSKWTLVQEVTMSYNERGASKTC